MLAAAITLSAADTNKPVTTTTSWLDSVTVAPVGAVRTTDLTGRSEWGAGLDLGYKVNPFVSLHVVNLAFEGPGQTSHSDDFKPTGKGGHGDGFTTGPNSWGGTAIDETDLLVKAIIGPMSTDKVSVYALAGGLHQWGEDQRWGLSAGGGLEYRLSKNFSLAGDYSVRMFSESLNGSSLDSLVRALVNVSF